MWDCRYYIGLCVTENAFHRELRKMRLPTDRWPAWVKGRGDATVHSFVHGDTGRLLAIVCVRPERKPVEEIAALLCHEAVHIWQWHCDEVGEKRPGSEAEAYGIQAIAQELMASYQALTGVSWKQARRLKG